jgi:hypothetical protein
MRLKMLWHKEGGQLVCRWVDSEEQETGEAVPMLRRASIAKEESELDAQVPAPGVGVDRAA